MATTTPEREMEERLDRFREDVTRLESEIGRVIVGQSEVVRMTVISMIAGGHVLLEGVPGLGKTLLVRTLADAVESSFSRIQFTPDLMPADLTGTNVLGEDAEGRRCFQFQKGPLFANVLLADEINRATPKTQSALLEAMQEHSVTVGGETHKLEGLFFVLATQNPLEMEGTYPLPEAQLDRFFCKILVEYPPVDDLMTILDRTTTSAAPTVESSVPAERVLEMGRLAREIPVTEEISRWGVELIMKTHPEFDGAPEATRRYVRYGSSPRGAQALMLAAKIHAILDNRYHVARHDLKSVVKAVLRHRMILNFEGQAEDVTTDNCLDEILKGS